MKNGILDIFDGYLKKDITEVFTIIIIYPDKNIEEIGKKIKIITDSLSSEIDNLKDIYVIIDKKSNCLTI
jgi:hypothetical protein